MLSISELQNIRYGYMKQYDKLISELNYLERMLTLSDLSITTSDGYSRVQLISRIDELKLLSVKIMDKIHKTDASILYQQTIQKCRE